jgi:hypothetical protein
MAIIGLAVIWVCWRWWEKRATAKPRIKPELRAESHFSIAKDGRLEAPRSAFSFPGLGVKPTADWVRL